MAAAYSLFGDRSLYYHWSGYLWRLLGALCFLWVLRIVWPRQRVASLVMSLFFLIYPGFLSQINPIDYQSQLLALFLAMLSMALTLEAIRLGDLPQRISLTIFSILLAVIYLSLVEYMIGLEALRLSLVLALVWRERLPSWRERLMKIAVRWIPFASGPLLFVIWRLFFFQSERRATDVGAQLGQLVGSPLYTGLWWLVHLVQDTWRVIFLAWAVPVYNLAFDLRLRDLLIGLGLSIFIAVLVLLSMTLPPLAEGGSRSNDSKWRTEALWIGFASVMAGLLPIIIVNRHADFGDYSRYTLASSAGGAMVAVALLYHLSAPRLRMAAVAVLTFFAAFTHYANAANAVLETQAMRNFWWQVSWRAPQIEKGTTLVASYPVGAIQEDYFVWGPADLIYYPEKSAATPVPISLGAAVLTDQNVLQILTGKGVENQVRRGIETPRDYGNVLILTQATSDGCVRILDGAQPELSSYDSQRVMLIASRSQIRDLSTEANFNLPPEAVFGPGPAHGWCYYYEKASLARQQGDWAQVARLGDEALAKGYYPADGIEWLPFLQAYVVVGDRDKLHSRASIMSADPFLKQQTCRILTVAARDNEMRNFVQSTFCD
jgi:hypothetical protein